FARSPTPKRCWWSITAHGLITSFRYFEATCGRTYSRNRQAFYHRSHQFGGIVGNLVASLGRGRERMERVGCQRRVAHDSRVRRRAAGGTASFPVAREG